MSNSAADLTALAKLQETLTRLAGPPDVGTRTRETRESIAGKSAQLRDRMRARDEAAATKSARTVTTPEGKPQPRKAVIGSIAAREDRRARNEQANAWAEHHRAERARGMERHAGGDE